jgi:hypothetical protein
MTYSSMARSLPIGVLIITLVVRCSAPAPTDKTPGDIIEGVDNTPDFDLGPNVPELTLTQGESGSVTLLVDRAAGADNANISIALSEGPSGVALSGAFAAGHRVQRSRSALN